MHSTYLLSYRCVSRDILFRFIAMTPVARNWLLAYDFWSCWRDVHRPISPFLMARGTGIVRAVKNPRPTVSSARALFLLLRVSLILSSRLALDDTSTIADSRLLPRARFHLD